ncbi:hypothetical protein ACFOGJ_29410 [Marinibaculum pumilum]|uniref:Lipoprotein n=1 Tax=Marinibaculum pumilum TaxID=1766165 RepID=A0ABV7L9W1_9PROT
MIDHSDRPAAADRAGRRRLLGLAAAGLAALAVAACGKKGDPAYPPDTVPGAPRARRDNSKVYPD